MSNVEGLPAERATESITLEQHTEVLPEAPQISIRRRVLDLAWPVIGESLLQTTLGIVDTILVAGLGVAALAGVGTAMNITYILVGAMTALTVGASVLVAQAIGAKEYGAANQFARQAIIWAILISLPLSALGFIFSEPIVGLFGLEPDASRIAVEYLHITVGTIAVLTVMLLASSVLRGAGNSRTPLVVTILVNVINLWLNYSLIYGHFGMPALGAIGSAWGTFVARLVGALVLVAILWRGSDGIRLAGSIGWRPQLGVVRDVLRIGLPAAFEEVVVIVAFAALTPIVASLGTDIVAAHRSVISILSFSFLPGIGFGLAATSLVAQSIGAQNRAEAREITSEAARWALIWMSGLGLLFILFASNIMQIFSPSPAMLAAGVASIQVVALIQPCWAGTFVYGAALRGMGDTRTPFLVSGGMMWVVVGLAYLVMRFYPSLPVVWATFLVAGPFEVWLLRRGWLRSLSQ
jgi:putative MATE family efflux protein